LGDTSFNGTAVFAPTTPAKLYMGTGTVTDVTSAISATNTTGAIASLDITPIAATNTGVTYTNAATLYIAGAPSAGTNVTITNPYSLYVAGGASYFGGLVTATGFSGPLNGTVGATTATTGAFTTLSATTATASAAVTINGTNATGGTFFLVQRSGVAKSYFGSSISISGVGTANDTDIYAVGDGRLFGGDQTTNFTRFTSTGLAVTGTLSATGTLSGGTSGTAYSFSGSAPATSLTLDSSGNLLVGATATIGNARFYALGSVADSVARFYNSSATTPSGVIVVYSNAAPNNTGSEFVYCSDTSALRASIRSNGGIANYAANNVILSDRREKTNFAPATSYLDKICAIPVQTFNYIDQNLEEDDGLTLGVVAQDVQAVAPEFVTESNWGSKENPKMRLEIYQTDLQYALMKCIQEQQAIITQLTARITALETT
jgi:hypothetical protein